MFDFRCPACHHYLGNEAVPGTDPPIQSRARPEAPAIHCPHCNVRLERRVPVWVSLATLSGFVVVEFLRYSLIPTLVAEHVLPQYATRLTSVIEPVLLLMLVVAVFVRSRGTHYMVASGPN